MSLATGKPALKTALLQFAANVNEGKTTDESLDEFLNALETWIKTAEIAVPGTGLTAPNGAVTGQANGTLT